MLSARRRISLCFALVMGCMTAGMPAQEVDVEKDARYGSLTWMQNSAEYRLLTEQIYRAALVQLQIGLNDPNWTADEVQLAGGEYQDKTPAIILDCDETVLDNSAYNARRVVEGLSYTTESWNEWCNEAKAGAIPGSLEFVRAAKALGVRIFFVTNRRDVVKAATVENLKSLGFPANDGNVMTKNPEQGRGDDKLSRRATIARNHRVVLLIGDSMSDLCSGMNGGNSEERNRIAGEKQHRLGSRWFILPNPVYGGWQQALPAGERALKLAR
ncbi:MAG: HAD family acid phosphatase [Planctomycetota bacterium]